MTARKTNLFHRNHDPKIKYRVQTADFFPVMIETTAKGDTMDIQTTNVKPSYCDKYLLTIREAACYFNIGTKKLRRLAEENLGDFAIISGNRFLINRAKFEKYISMVTEI